jgi:hypothetical protein
VRASTCLSIAGWTVLVVGSLASIATFLIDHMNRELWAAMIVGVVASVVVGGALIVVWRRVR